MSDFYCRRSLSWFKLDYFLRQPENKKKNIPLGFLLGLLCPRLSQLKASPLAA